MSKKIAGFSALSEKEEKVFRIKNGVSIEPDALLERKTTNPVLLAQLLELERAFLSRASKKK